MKMKWSSLTNPIRLKTSNKTKENVRSPFLRDVDKIIFSPFFRKLQDKTQVYPLAKSSYVRTRLTHSMEASTVARSLGSIIGKEIIKKYKLTNIKFYEFGYIIQAAALAHDIGNPPFGHKGESTISSFYKNFFKELKNKPQKELSDTLINGLNNIEETNFTKFDGNAQGFRIITSIARKNTEEGLNLTYPVLATFCKYPNFKEDKGFIESKKIGIFSSEKIIFNDIKNKLNLITINKDLTARHPLAFLLEAADDICYLVADLCDAFFVNILSFEEVYKEFNKIINSEASKDILRLDYLNQLQTSYIQPLLEEYNKTHKHNDVLRKKISKQLIESLASEVINILTLITANTFLKNEEKILKGKFNKSLLISSPIKKEIYSLREIAEKRIYNSREKNSQELKGTIAIKKVLQEFTNVVVNLCLKKSTTKTDLISRLYLQNIVDENNSLQENLQLVNDYVVSCTDNNIIEIFKNLTGI